MKPHRLAMESLRRQIQLLEDLKTDVFTILQRAFNDEAEVMVQEITQNQLFEQGVDGRGTKLAPYSNPYRRFKIAIGQPVDRTTLKLTGDFYDSIELVAFEQFAQITGNVEYTEHLVNRYGPDILRPSNEVLGQFLTSIYIPELKEFINQKTGVRT